MAKSKGGSWGGAPGRGGKGGWLGSAPRGGAKKGCSMAIPQALGMTVVVLLRAAFKRLV